MANILVVCTANICRSPVAEVLLRDRLQKRGLGDWQVSSAGTWASGGQSATAYGIELMAEQGLDIKDHQSRIVDEQNLTEADLVLCMETGHVEALRAEFPRLANKIYLLTEMSGRHYSVVDPYGGPKPAYEQMTIELTNLIEGGLDRIVKLAEVNERGRRAPGLYFTN